MGKDVSKTAVIAGGGVGGLATAIGLGQLGWDVTVLERAVQFGDAGAGLQISANGYKVLRHLGVSDFLAPYEFEPSHLELRMGQTGTRVFALPIQQVSSDRWRAPYIHIKRSDLIWAFVQRLQTLPNVVVKFNQSVTGYVNLGESRGVHVDARGTAGQGADLFVAADGIKSVVRDQMHGPDTPRFTGNVAWRTLVPIDALGDLAPPPTACVWAGDRRHAVTTRVGGGGYVNFVGIVEQDNWAEEAWHIKGSKSDALADFAGWHPTIQTILTQAPALHRWAIFDRPPLPFWNDGAVTLLGDAAHAMVPSMAQGAGQALEDACQLTQLLAHGGDIPAALQNLYTLRAARTARVQTLSSQNLRKFHRASPMAKALTFGPMWVAGKIAPRFALRQFDWLYGHQI